MNGYLGEEELSSYEDTPYEGYAAKNWALTYISSYSQIDGAHHKQWVLDQVARILKGTPVKLAVARWNNGHEEYRFSTGEPSEAYLLWVEEMKGKKNEEGEYEYDYDEGIAP
jgi:hypothetical protein